MKKKTTLLLAMGMAIALGANACGKSQDNGSTEAVAENKAEAVQAEAEDRETMLILHN